MDEVSEKTRHNTGTVLTIAINYGSRVEIVQAVRHLVQEQLTLQVKNGSESEKITAWDDALLMQKFEQNLMTCNTPDPDLLIRTSGEQRISNFLLWQCAYTEFVFTERLWPDFSEEDFKNAVYAYAKRERRYGAV
jgi:undecaprenyl diphosphate synthase